MLATASSYHFCSAADCARADKTDLTAADCLCDGDAPYLHCHALAAKEAAAKVQGALADADVFFDAGGWCVYGRYSCQVADCGACKELAYGGKRCRVVAGWLRLVPLARPVQAQPIWGSACLPTMTVCRAGAIAAVAC